MKPWKAYSPTGPQRDIVCEFQGSLQIIPTLEHGDCGVDSIAVVMNCPRNDTTFNMMREFCRSNPTHDLSQEYCETPGKFWLEVEDLVYLCTQKYDVFPIIINGNWTPSPKPLKKKRSIAQMRHRLHGVDQTNMFACPFFAQNNNLYVPPLPTQKIVIFKMIKQRHYQPLGILVEQNVKTQFIRKDIPDIWFDYLEIDCFHPISNVLQDNDFQLEQNKAVNALEILRSTFVCLCYVLILFLYIYFFFAQAGRR
jgi:hypothetical protein